MLDKELEKTVKRAIELATNRRHEIVTTEHLLAALMDDPHARETLESCGGDVDELKVRLIAYLDNDLSDIVVSEADFSKPEATPGFQRIIQRASIHVQSRGKNEAINGANVLISIFAEKDSFAAYFLDQAKITRFDAVNWLSHGVKKGEEADREDELASVESHGGVSHPRSSSNKALKEFAKDLNEKAKNGKIDSLIGRSKEVQRTVQILCRRSKNNPIYVGEPGVGKTAIAEGLAKRIVDGDIPGALKDSKIYALDMAAVVAGTRYRGDFEERMKSIIEELKADPNAIIFIDEIHTVVGAGSSSGSLDASNILKPALASGEIQCIGSTTYQEYRQHFEKDAAMARRFQKVDVKEPTKEEAIEIVKGLKPYFEDYHNVKYSDEAIKASVNLSIRYLHNRHLPDKAIDLIDETGAFFKADNDNKEDIVVSVKDMENVVAQIAQIPTQQVNKNDKEVIKNLGRDLQTVVFGQDKAVEVITNAVKMAKAGLRNPDKPIGSYLFTGPTGVGKTELTRQLSNVLNLELHRFDMSEYMEKHAVSRLVGAPPGYVGYDQGGQLTDAVSKTPYCVVLLDEVEKAHPDMFNILLQVMDYGKLTDSNGRTIDFRNVILIMTSNAGAADMAKPGMGFVRDKRVEDDKEALKKFFTPEFRNRLDAIVPFERLKKEAIGLVVDKFIAQLESQMSDKSIFMELDDKAREWLGEKGYDPLMGARPLERVIQEHISQPLADEILFGELEHGGNVKISIKDDKVAFSFEQLRIKTSENKSIESG